MHRIIIENTYVKVSYNYKNLKATSIVEERIKKPQ